MLGVFSLFMCSRVIVGWFDGYLFGFLGSHAIARWCSGRLFFISRVVAGVLIDVCCAFLLLFAHASNCQVLLNVLGRLCFTSRSMRCRPCGLRGTL